ncbi:hypothetical protein FKW77_000071 [Venturia effusa]|uniref:D-arabinono-1,4-lactone oxidase n=1 Tax=Venturia effusa TaxID=50376 RepID=A0A517LPB1_9PEZI|nr:hypothetical protein FKW77_000071 [Venturia effusa]
MARGPGIVGYLPIVCLKSQESKSQDTTDRGMGEKASTCMPRTPDFRACLACIDFGLAWMGVGLHPILPSLPALLPFQPPSGSLSPISPRIFCIPTRQSRIACVSRFDLRQSLPILLDIGLTISLGARPHTCEKDLSRLRPAAPETTQIYIQRLSRENDYMAPASGSAHPDDEGEGELQAPTPPPTAAMSSSLDRHQNGANPTTQYPYGSAPSVPPNRQGVSSVPYTTDFGMVMIIVIDGDGNALYTMSTPADNLDGGAHVSTSLALTPLAEASSTGMPFRTSSPATNSAMATSSSSLSLGTGSEFQRKPGPHGPTFPVIIALSIIFPTIIIALSLCAFYFLCIRRRRQTRQDHEGAAVIAARRVPEMKNSGPRGDPNMLNARALASDFTPADVSLLTPPATTSSAGTATPPVILTTTMNDAYYTGIDTSDHISLNDHRSEASADTFGEEPPPPYRPRSVPPISRETSVRTSICRNTSLRSSRHDPLSGSNLMRRSVDVRSPFDDPEDSDDDNLSQISTIRSLPRRDTDRLSVVSDMSYREEPLHASGATLANSEIGRITPVVSPNMNDSILQRELSKLDLAGIPFRAVQNHTHHTWAKTFHSHPSLYIQPQSLAEIQKLVHLARRCRKRLVVVGSAHCPNTITCTSSWMVNLDEYDKVLRVDKEKRLLTVQAGVRLGALNMEAKRYGWTIPNLGSIDQQSLAGAIATGTHGSSLYHGILSQWVHSLSLVLANGEVVKCSAQQNKDLFQAALVSLGALGIVVEVEYQMVAATNIEWVQTLQSMDAVLGTWGSDLWTQAEFTRVWWLPYLHRAVVWRARKSQKEHVAPKSNWYGGAVGFHTYHMLLWLSSYIPRILPAVEWFVFGMQYGFSTGTFITAVEEQRTGLLMNCLYSQFVNEWALPLSQGPETIRRLSAWLNGRESESGIPFSAKGLWVHSPIEVRVSDTSKHAGQARPFLDISYDDGPTLYLNATLYRAYGIDPPCKDRYYEGFEWLMRDVGAKPHWAKNFLTTQRSDFEEMYGDKLQSWRRVRREVDPEGLFVGDWLRQNVLEAPRKEPLLCEEIEVCRTAQGKNRGGGVEWFGKQAFTSTEGLTKRRNSSRSSEESFGQVASAEIEEDMLVKSLSEDQGSPVDFGDFHSKPREGAGKGLDGTKVFEKM